MYNVNNQKGITLMSLTIYITILTIVIGVMTIVSTTFYDNISELTNTPRYLSEFNKFTMFFATDVKNYNSATVTDNTVIFEEGPTYKFQGVSIYRNDVKIAGNILACKFQSKTYNVNSITKNIISVYMKIGKDSQNYTEKEIEFTLRYW